MSNIIPKLGNVDVHWYKLETDRPADPVQPEIHSDRNTSFAFPRLKECSLRGVYASENDLLRFVEAVRPVALTLKDVHLTSGTYTSLFEYLTAKDTPVRYICLDDIREGARLVHFNIPRRPKFRYSGGNMGPSTLVRDADRVKEAIRYRTTARRPMGSGEGGNVEFDPPTQARYDAVRLTWRRSAVGLDG
ncbi:hypothetical protein F5Y05DRAFT_372027 [Hypoxylon sp. FL0543]|nr:hypothetical protein F5Y05DRAFT_372027 [Hypoxylon sp. FL0543]